MAEKTITLACSDFKSIRDLLRKQGATTSNLDKLIGEHGDDDRLSMSQTYEWWCVVVNRIHKSLPKLAYRMTIMASSSESSAPKQRLSKEGRKLLKQLNAEDDE